MSKYVGSLIPALLFASLFGCSNSSSDPDPCEGGASSLQASLSSNYSFGNLQTIFRLDASGSRDANCPDRVLYYRWDTDGDGVYDTAPSTNGRIELSFATEGLKIVKVEVSDTSAGKTSTEAALPIRVVDREYATITTWCGTGIAGATGENVPLLETELFTPQDMTIAPDGTAYILSWNAHRVLRVNGARTETICGTGTLGDAPEGTATAAGLNHPTAITVDPQGRLILAAWHNSMIMRIDPSTDRLSRIAGVRPLNGTTSNRCFHAEDEGAPAVKSCLDLPVSAAFDSQDRMYISDQKNVRIARVDLVDGVITDLKETGTVVADQGTILRSADGVSWSSQSSGTPNDLERVVFVDAFVGTAVGAGGIILRSEDGGQSWTPQDSGTQQTLHSVYFTDANVGTAVGALGTIVRTEDGGQSWTPQTTGVDADLHSVWFFDEFLGMVAGKSGTIFYTEDGGQNWEARTPESTTDLFGISMSSAEVAVAVGSNGTILHTLDAGLNWTTIDGGVGSTLHDVAFGTEKRGLAVGEAGVVLYTINGGIAWQRQTTGTSRALYAVGYTNATSVTVVGEAGTILRSADEGVSWTSQASGTTRTIRGVSFTDPDPALQSSMRTIAGMPGVVGFNGNGLDALETKLSAPGGQSADPTSRIQIRDDILYIADTQNDQIRSIDLSLDNPTVELFAGKVVNGVPQRSYNGDDGPATDAALNKPVDIALDSAGNVFIADTFNNVIRRVDAVTGIITTVVGSSFADPCAETQTIPCDLDLTDGAVLGDGGDPLKAYLARPYGIEFDANDNLYIVDTYHHRIRIVRK